MPCRRAQLEGNHSVATARQCTPLRMSTGAPGAVLQGTTTVNAVAGVATFSDLRIDRAATGYVLTFAGHIIETGTSSYRLAHTRKRRNHS